MAKKGRRKLPRRQPPEPSPSPQNPPDTPLEAPPEAERERVEAALKQLGEIEDLFFWAPEPPPINAEWPDKAIFAARDVHREALRSDAVLSTARMIRLVPPNGKDPSRPATRAELEAALPRRRRKRKSGASIRPRVKHLEQKALALYRAHRGRWGARPIAEKLGVGKSTVARWLEGIPRIQ